MLAPAIRLAENGYPINQSLTQMIEGGFGKDLLLPAVLWPYGRRVQPGDLFRQPELAATLRRIAEHGRKGFEEEITFILGTPREGGPEMAAQFIQPPLEINSGYSTVLVVAADEGAKRSFIEVLVYVFEKRPAGWTLVRRVGLFRME